MKKAISTLLSLLIPLQLAGPAVAATPDPEPAPLQCEARVALVMKERDALIGFNSRLSHLQYFHGRPTFESKLQSIVQQHWPMVRLEHVSPLFLERTVMLVEQERLKHAIANTIGLENDSWKTFHRTMRMVTFHDGGVNYNADAPFDKTMKSLLKEIQAHSPARKPENLDELKAEAILRATNMGVVLLQWSIVNRKIVNDRGATAARKLALMGIGMIGTGILVGTTVFAGPIVAAGGTAAASLSANPANAALLMKLGEVAAGSFMGLVGAPAATATASSLHVYTEAAKVSNNHHTEFGCELFLRVEEWKKRAPSELLSSALVGAGLGVAGGALTLNATAAKVVLYSTVFGVGVAQAYSLGHMTKNTLDALAYYKLAEEAAQKGEWENAREYLFRARDYAQIASEKALEAVIVGVLAVQIGVSLKQAIIQGAREIRQLYAASSDTLPSAAKSIEESLGKKEE